MVLGNRIIYGLKPLILWKKWVRLTHASIFDLVRRLGSYVRDRSQAWEFRMNSNRQFLDFRKMAQKCSYFSLKLDKKNLDILMIHFETKPWNERLIVSEACKKVLEIFFIDFCQWKQQI